MIGRRPFLLHAAAFGLHLGTGHAQSGNPKRVGVMVSFSEGDEEGRARLATFLQQMRELGWPEGRAIRYDIRWHAGDLTLAREQARELVALAPDAMLVNGTLGMTAIREVTNTIPITFVVVADPVGAGFVTSLSRPGGNITGFSSFEPELGPKWLELIRTIAPTTRHVGVLSDPSVSGFVSLQRAIVEAAPRFGFTSEDVLARNGAEIAGGLARLFARPNAGLVVLPPSINSVERVTIRRIVAAHRAPAIYPFAFHAREGGLIAYGFDGVDLFRRAAGYVSRLLRGDLPANLPVQAPTKFELAINLKTAQQLGLSVPALLLAQADEVIE